MSLKSKIIALAKVPISDQRWKDLLKQYRPEQIIQVVMDLQRKNRSQV